MTPDAYTIQETFLEVGDGHTLYTHEWGNKRAKTPIVFLHGGPGGGCRDKRKEIFDPTRQRVIFFDQRGAGRSLPCGSLKHNTTDDLIEDINKITDHLGVSSFIIHGGSWGSTLALSYALKHPKKVKAMVIHGIWTASKWETDWLENGQLKTFFPDVWERYVATVPPKHQNDPTSYHCARMFTGNAEEAKASAYAYGNLEGAAISLDDRFTPEDYETFEPERTIIEAYYVANGCFMPERHILDNAHKLTMPVYIVQGRYDNVCPPITAYELHQSLPNSELIWTTSGHRAERESWNVMRTILLELTK